MSDALARPAEEFGGLLGGEALLHFKEMADRDLLELPRGVVDFSE
jgi:hypothetical protein